LARFLIELHRYPITGGNVRSMILALSLALTIIPLLGIAWIFMNGMITLSPPSATVDGLFMTLILLALSGTFLLNAYWEMRDQGMIGKKKTAAPATKSPAAKAT
jgi:hypothetical protein